MNSILTWKGKRTLGWNEEYHFVKNGEKDCGQKLNLIRFAEQMHA